MLSAFALLIGEPERGQQIVQWYKVQFYAKLLAQVWGSIACVYVSGGVCAHLCMWSVVVVKALYLLF